MAHDIEVRCAPDTAQRLALALQAFVASHYPYAADECSAAAREVLLDLARSFETQLRTTGACVYSQRVRAFVCEAVRAYCEALERSEGCSYRERCALYTAIVRGRPADRDDELAAERVDLGGGSDLE